MSNSKINDSDYIVSPPNTEGTCFLNVSLTLLLYSDKLSDLIYKQLSDPHFLAIESGNNAKVVKNNTNTISKVKNVLKYVLIHTFNQKFNKDIITHFTNMCYFREYFVKFTHTNDFSPNRYAKSTKLGFSAFLILKQIIDNIFKKSIVLFSENKESNQFHKIEKKKDEHSILFTQNILNQNSLKEYKDNDVLIISCNSQFGSIQNIFQNNNEYTLDACTIHIDKHVLCGVTINDKEYILENQVTGYSNDNLSIGCSLVPVNWKKNIFNMRYIKKTDDFTCNLSLEEESSESRNAKYHQIIDISFVFVKKNESKIIQNSLNLPFKPENIKFVNILKSSFLDIKKTKNHYDNFGKVNTNARKPNRRHNVINNNPLIRTIESFLPALEIDTDKTEKSKNFNLHLIFTILLFSDDISKYIKIENESIIAILQYLKKENNINNENENVKCVFKKEYINNIVEKFLKEQVTSIINENATDEITMRTINTFFNNYDKYNRLFNVLFLGEKKEEKPKHIKTLELKEENNSIILKSFYEEIEKNGNQYELYEITRKNDIFLQTNLILKAEYLNKYEERSGFQEAKIIILQIPKMEAKYLDEAKTLDEYYFKTHGYYLNSCNFVFPHLQIEQFYKYNDQRIYTSRNKYHRKITGLTIEGKECVAIHDVFYLPQDHYKDNQQKPKSVGFPLKVFPWKETIFDVNNLLSAKKVDKRLDNSDYNDFMCFKKKNDIKENHDQFYSVESVDLIYVKYGNTNYDENSLYHKMQNYDEIENIPKDALEKIYKFNHFNTHNNHLFNNAPVNRGTNQQSEVRNNELFEEQYQSKKQSSRSSSQTSEFKSPAQSSFRQTNGQGSRSSSNRTYISLNSSSGQASKQGSRSSSQISELKSPAQSSFRQTNRQESRQTSRPSSGQESGQASRPSSGQASGPSSGQASGQSSSLSSRPSSGQASRPSSGQESEQGSRPSSRQPSDQASGQAHDPPAKNSLIQKDNNDFYIINNLSGEKGIKISKQSIITLKNKKSTQHNQPIEQQTEIKMTNKSISQNFINKLFNQKNAWLFIFYMLLLSDNISKSLFFVKEEIKMTYEIKLVLFCIYLMKFVDIQENDNDINKKIDLINDFIINEKERNSNLIKPIGQNNSTKRTSILSSITNFFSSNNSSNKKSASYSKKFSDTLKFIFKENDIIKHQNNKTNIENYELDACFFRENDTENFGFLYFGTQYVLLLFHQNIQIKQVNWREQDYPDSHYYFVKKNICDFYVDDVGNLKKIFNIMTLLLQRKNKK